MPIANNKQFLNSSLLTAVIQEKSEMVGKLLEDGADPGFNNGAPLLRAAANGHSEIVAMLLKAKTDVAAINSDGMTALHFAAAREHSEVVVLLLKAKPALVNTKDYYQKTPLCLAAKNRDPETIILLVRACVSHHSAQELANANLGDYGRAFAGTTIPVNRYRECWDDENLRAAICTGALQKENDLDKIIEHQNQPQKLPLFRL